MNNKQLFDLTSHPSAEFDTAQELLQYCNNHAKNTMAMQWQPKIRKERKISQSNVILGESTEKFKNIQWQKKEDKLHTCSPIVHLIHMAKKVLMESGDLLSKYQS